MSEGQKKSEWGLIGKLLAGIVVGVLGFDPSGVALLLAIFALQDSFGTATNITGDGAITLMLEGLFNKDSELSAYQQTVTS